MVPSQGAYISHVGKRNIIFKNCLGGGSVGSYRRVVVFSVLGVVLFCQYFLRTCYYDPLCRQIFQKTSIPPSLFLEKKVV